MLNNTLFSNILRRINDFLKITNYKQIRYRPSLFNNDLKKMVGIVEIVSNGKEIWWEQNKNRIESYDLKKKDKNHISGYRIIYGAPDLYKFNIIEFCINEFFNLTAPEVMKHLFKKQKYAKKRTQG